jgi:hypothetical protein
MKIDLGVPLLSLILILWAILVMISIFYTIFGRENLKEVKNFFLRFFDTHSHKKQKNRPL